MVQHSDSRIRYHIYNWNFEAWAVSASCKGCKPYLYHRRKLLLCKLSKSVPSALPCILVTNGELAIHRSMEAPYGCMEPVHGFQGTINCKDLSTNKDMTKTWLQEKQHYRIKQGFWKHCPCWRERQCYLSDISQRLPMSYLGWQR